MHITQLIAHCDNSTSQHHESKVLYTREQAIARLTTTEEFDLLIVGAGATGSGSI